MLDSKEISAVELTEQYLDRIEKSDKEINSYITVCKENALADAKKAQEVIEQLATAVHLRDCLFRLKNNICTLGVKTTCASHMLDDFILRITQRYGKLKKDNIVILGKTNMDEFAVGSTTESSYFQATHNPWNLDRVPGGSSGGSAAAIAAGEAIWTLGSDTGGSIRQPASFNAVSVSNRPMAVLPLWLHCLCFFP